MSLKLSWEGFCIEQILRYLPRGATASHYRTQAGAEVDLVIEKADGEILAVEIKRTLSPKVTPGLVESMETLQASQAVIIIPQGASFPLSKTVTATGLRPFLQQCVQLPIDASVQCCAERAEASANGHLP